MALAPLEHGDPPRVGRYRLTARLGAGGMGVVYLGEGDDGQQAAVKVLRPVLTDDEDTRARFRREALALGRVRNRHTVRVLDADPDGSPPYLATEFADGLSLDEQVKTYGPLSPEAVVTLAAGLAEALTAIHAADVMHRDLKPSNILLTSAGPVVVDFGIALTADASSITESGMTIGSPGYMAPEQATGHAIVESDIFAWALVVAFASSGRPPFGTGAAIGIIHRILTEAPDISAVPPRLMPLVTKAVAKEPAQRPSAADLARDLSPEEAGEAETPGVPGAAGEAEAPGAAEVVEGAEPATAAQALVSRPPRRRAGVVALAAAALSAVAVLAAVGGLLLSEGGSKPGGPAPGHAGARPTTTRTVRPTTSGRPTSGGGAHPVKETAAPVARAANPTKPRRVSARVSAPGTSPPPVRPSPAPSRVSSPTGSASLAPSPSSSAPSPSSSSSAVSTPTSSSAPSQPASDGSAPATGGTGSGGTATSSTDTSGAASGDTASPGVVSSSPSASPG